MTKKPPKLSLRTHTVRQLSTAETASVAGGLSIPLPQYHAMPDSTHCGGTRPGQ